MKTTQPKEQTLSVPFYVTTKDERFSDEKKTVRGVTEMAQSCSCSCTGNEGGGF